MSNMTPLQSKLAAVALLVGALSLLGAAMAVPWWMLNRHYGAAVDDASARLERYLRIAGMRDGLQQKAIEVKALEGRHHFLKSASPALAAAELQEQVKATLEEYGGKLSSIQILPHKDDKDYRQVAVSLQLSAPLSGVKAMLHALESARPYLFIENFAIRVQNIGAARTDANVDPELFVQFDVTGYALKGEQ